VQDRSKRKASVHARSESKGVITPSSREDERRPNYHRQPIEYQEDYNHKVLGGKTTTITILYHVPSVELDIEI